MTELDVLIEGDPIGRVRTSKAALKSVPIDRSSAKLRTQNGAQP